MSKKAQMVGIPATKVAKSFLFEMAAMPFPCNGILVVMGNFLRVFTMSSFLFIYLFIGCESKRTYMTDGVKRNERSRQY